MFCSFFSSSFCYVLTLSISISNSLFAVLAYLHHSAVREEAEKKRTKFNADYDPAQTDCKVELPFTKARVEEVTLYLGQTTSCGI